MFPVGIEVQFVFHVLISFIVSYLQDFCLAVHVDSVLDLPQYGSKVGWPCSAAKQSVCKLSCIH